MSPIAKDLGAHMSTEVSTTVTRHMAIAHPVVPADELAIIVIQAVASAAASGIASYVASAKASGAIRTSPEGLADALFSGLATALQESRTMVLAEVARVVPA